MSFQATPPPPKNEGIKIYIAEWKQKWVWKIVWFQFYNILEKEKQYL